MTVKPIRTAEDLQEVLALIWKLHDAKPGTPDGDELEVLSTLADAFQREHLPMPPPDPIAAIKFRLEQGGLSRKDLEPHIGTRARVSEILTGTRQLTLPMIRALHTGLGIPYVSLLGETAPKKSKSKQRSRERSHSPRARLSKSA